jgi:hypothetical protein
MVMALIDDLKNRYRNGDVLTRLLFINIGVFVLLLLLDITFTLITVGRTGFAAELFQYPWNPAILLLYATIKARKAETIGLSQKRNGKARPESEANGHCPIGAASEP